MATVRGGEKLARALEEIGRKLGKKPTLRVGFLEGATYPDGTKVALVAAINNYGAPAAGIPPRPFFTRMVAERSPEWPAKVRAALLAADYDADRALRLVGEELRGELQQAIVDFVGVPLAEATKARKGHDKQLIDTSHMLNSASYEVKE